MYAVYAIEGLITRVSRLVGWYETQLQAQAGAVSHAYWHYDLDVKADDVFRKGTISEEKGVYVSYRLLESTPDEGMPNGGEPLILDTDKPRGLNV